MMERTGQPFNFSRPFRNFNSMRKVISKICAPSFFINPTAAAELLNSIPDGKLKSNVIINLAYQWALTSPEAATAWAQTIANAEDSANAIAAIDRATGQ